MLNVLGCGSGAGEEAVAAPATVLGVLLALFFMRRTYRFERWEGTCMVLFYLIFLVFLQLNR